MIAAVLSFIFAGSLAGVREGTVIAALLVGFIARLIGKKLAFLKDMIFPESVSVESENEAKEQTAGIYGKNVIAIGRQFGSGGHDIGKVLAEKLGYDFYDAEIIQMIPLSHESKTVGKASKRTSRSSTQGTKTD